MPIFIGWTIVVACCLGGFALAGGHLVALFQPIEILIILGSAIGGFIVANGFTISKQVLNELPSIFKPTRYTKEFYVEVLLLLYVILVRMRKEGPLALEPHIEAPYDSPIFTNFQKACSDHHVIEFLVDYLRLILSGNLSTMTLENLMDLEIDTHHAEGHVAVAAMAALGDGLPAFGIVAAVMGVVHTMGSVGNASPAELGQMVGAALVGTFLGILMCYAFVSPLSTALNHNLTKGSKALEIIKVTLLATLNGYPPPIAVEFGRKIMFSHDKPSFSELEENFKPSQATNM